MMMMMMMKIILTYSLMDFNNVCHIKLAGNAFHVSDADKYYYG